jgi:hypothetical protein
MVCGGVCVCGGDGVRRAWQSAQAVVWQSAQAVVWQSAQAVRVVRAVRAVRVVRASKSEREQASKQARLVWDQTPHRESAYPPHK